MSVPAVLVVRSLTASVSEYGDDVRVIGMTSSGCSVPLPADSRVSTRWPSSDPVRMCAVVSEPSWTVAVDGERRPARRRRCSDMVDTVPTLIPDTVTSLPVRQAAGLGKQRLVADRGGPRQQLLGLQPDGDDQHDQDNADESGRMRLAPRYLSIGLRAPSRLLA